MNTAHHYPSKGGRTISLNSYEKIPLERPQAGESIEITVKSGIIRIAANQPKNAEDITLAFACRADIFKFHYPGDIDITIEAITDTSYLVESKSICGFRVGISQASYRASFANSVSLSRVL